MSTARVRRRALVVALNRFRPAHQHGREPEPGWNDLPYAAGRAQAMAAALGRFDYDVSVHVQGAGDSPGLTAAELGACVLETAAQLHHEDALVVHVLSHGRREEDGALYVVGADGACHERAEVGHWLRSLRMPGMPHALFLLDLCHSGVVTRAPGEMAVADGRARAWAIAACAPGQQAFNGRFTQAATTVLERLASKDTQIDPSYPHVPLDTFARLVRSEVRDLVDDEGGFPQQVVGSVLDISADLPDLPFFPLAHSPTPRRRAVESKVHGGLVPFLHDLDEGLDPEHFIERAEGLGVLPREQGLGCFSGRRGELKTLSSWLDGHDDIRFRVVTGSPGVGKSALVGVVVCAAHPQLRKPTEWVWRHLERTPYANRHLAAVHARQRDLAGIVASIRQQLALGRGEEGLDLPGFFDQLRRREHPPTIVIDALDEAEQYQQVADQLLLPLTRLDRPDGTPACRVLVATRPWPEFKAVLDVAKEIGGLVDLDDVPDRQLLVDLERYISELLRHQPPYHEVSHVGARQTFAASVAEVLTRNRRDASGQRWGEFLVAGLYTHHLITAHDPIKDVEVAAALGADVPLTLPALLELELAARTGVKWFRPLLVALAHARGDGMPAETAVRVAEVFAPAELGPASIPGIIAALQTARFYLRRTGDVDGTVLYRLFHQGLSDHLQLHPVDGPETPESGSGDDKRLFAALLNPIEVPGAASRRWDLAEPYLRRHIVQHGNTAELSELLLTDAEFLVYADPPTVTAALSAHPLPWLASDEYQQLAQSADNVRARRFGLTMLALRKREAAAAEQLSRPPGMLPWLWRPHWITDVREPISDAHIAHLASGPAMVQPIKTAECPLIAVATPSGQVSLWEADGPRIRWAVALPASLDDLKVVKDGRSPAVEARTTDGTWYVIDARMGRPVPRPHRDAVARPAKRQPTVQHVRTERGMILLAATPDRPEIRIYQDGPDGRTPLGLITTRHPVTALGATASAGTLHLAVAGGGEVSLERWNLRKLTGSGRTVLGQASGVRSLHCLRVRDEVSVVVNGDAVTLWRRPARTPDPESRRISALTSPPTGASLFVGTTDGSIVFVDSEDGRVSGGWRPHDREVTAIATAWRTDGHQVLLSGSVDGDVAAWDLTAGTPLLRKAGVHTRPVSALTMFVMDGEARVLSYGLDDSVLTDISTGETTLLAADVRWNSRHTAQPSPITVGQRRVLVSDDPAAPGITVTDLAGAQVVDSLPLGGSIQRLSATPAGDLVVTDLQQVVFLKLASAPRADR